MIHKLTLVLALAVVAQGATIVGSDLPTASEVTELSAQINFTLDPVACAEFQGVVDSVLAPCSYVRQTATTVKTTPVNVSVYVTPTSFDNATVRSTASTAGAGSSVPLAGNYNPLADTIATLICLPASSTTTPVPEPGTAAVGAFGLSLVAANALRNRRR